MSTFTVHADVNTYMPLQLIRSEDKIRDIEFNGTRCGKSWIPLQVKLVHEHPLVLGDFIKLETVLGVLVCNRKALECLLPHLQHDMEVLPLAVVNHDDNCYLLNFLNVIDCLDEANSKIRRFTTSQRILAVEEYAFVESKMRHSMLFKVPQLATRTLFCNDDFKHIIQENKLTGLEFRRL